MIRRLTLLGASLVLIAPAGAQAQARPLTRPDGTKGAVIIWRSDKAHDEGVKLIGAGVNKSNPAVLLPLVACAPAAGDQVVVTDGGFFSSTVTVISGKQAGCRGVVENEYLKSRERAAEPPTRKKDARGDVYPATSGGR